jgi:hypothetical protein
VIVVLDTNQFHGDPRMSLRNFRILLAQHEQGTIELAIPEVVLQELPKMHAREYAAARAKVTGGLEKLRALGHDAETPPGLSEAAEAQRDYAAWLRGYLAKRSVRTSALPGTDLGRLLADSVAERRPWRPDSKGFRDALIWYTVLELAAECEVILITNNSRDFAQAEQARDVLHPELRRDVVALGHGEERVRLAPSLLHYIQHYVSPAEQQLLHVRERLKSDQPWREDLWNQVEQSLWRLELETWDEVTVVRSDYAEIDNIEVAEVAVEDVQITNAYEAGIDGSISLELEVHAVAHFSFTTDTGGMEWLAREGADVQFDIHEETFSQGSTLARYLIVTYAVDYAPQTGELADLEKIRAVEDPART